MQDMPGTPLLERTLKLLSEAPQPLKVRDIARKTGLSPSWISRFASGHIPNPGVVHVQALHDYLAGTEG